MNDAIELIPPWAKLVMVGVTAGFAVGVAWALVRSGNKSRATASHRISDDVHSLEAKLDTALQAFGESLSPVVAKVDRIHVELVGYSGADGLLADMKSFREELKAAREELGTVDERIRLNRHDLRNEFAAIILRLETKFDQRIVELDRRITLDRGAA